MSVYALPVSNLADRSRKWLAVFVQGRTSIVKYNFPTVGEFITPVPVWRLSLTLARLDPKLVLRQSATSSRLGSFLVLRKLITTAQRYRLSRSFMKTDLML